MDFMKQPFHKYGNNLVGVRMRQVDECAKYDLQTVRHDTVMASDNNPATITTGGSRPLLPCLRASIRQAQAIDLIVAFLMESGVKLLLDDLDAAVRNGIPIRIICGNTLGITQPEALYQLRERLGDKISLRFFSDPVRSFHPKAYFFHHTDHSELYIGSSNVSRSALTDGVEWNVRLDSRRQAEEVEQFRQEFERIYMEQADEIDDVMLRRYSIHWREQKTARAAEAAAQYVIEPARGADADNPTHETSAGSSTGTSIGYSTGATIGTSIGTTTGTATGTATPTSTENPIPPAVRSFPEPNGPQLEALYAIRRTREAGNHKALVVAATGVGKTYLAAFASKEFKTVLFLAHREELLHQARRVFSTVRNESETGLFIGDVKNVDADVLFASVQALGRAGRLNEAQFPKARFDCIIIDEFHHAVVDSYRRILDWFEPDFLLGLTATPERMDNRDVFSLCDYNVVYDVRLKEAIGKGWLVPFHYYGVHDDTIRYEDIPWRGGQYDPEKLEVELSIHKRAELILEHWRRLSSHRAIGFCAGRRHAAFMADAFRKAGIPAYAVMSDTTGIDQLDAVLPLEQALRMLQDGSIRVLFAVDMLNEGVDLPSVDLLMFLRPTESGTVFLQQLGRGLRKARGKAYVTVLDFIGNYRNIRMIPSLLQGNGGTPGSGRGFNLPDPEDYPDGCRIQFDWRVIDLFRELERKRAGITTKDFASMEFKRIREQLERVPSQREFYEQMEDETWLRIRKSPYPVNPLRDWLQFLVDEDAATDGERALRGTAAHRLLQTLAETSMTKTYKMPLLLAFHQEGRLRRVVGESEIARSFQTFFSHAAFGEDMLRDGSSKGFREWSDKEYMALARKNPMKYLAQSASDFFVEDGKDFAMKVELQPWLENPDFVRLYLDTVRMRTVRYCRERLSGRELEWYGG